MKTPGVKVKPIRTLDQGHDVNEVFFDEVEVPIDEPCRRGESGLDDREVPAGSRARQYRGHRHVQTTATTVEGVCAHPNSSAASR